MRGDSTAGDLHCPIDLLADAPRVVEQLEYNWIRLVYIRRNFSGSFFLKWEYGLWVSLLLKFKIIRLNIIKYAANRCCLFRIHSGICVECIVADLVFVFSLFSIEQYSHSRFLALDVPSSPQHGPKCLFCPHRLSPFQLPGGRRDESGPRRPADPRPHVLGAGPGQAEALHLPAAGPPQPAQQEGAPPDDDAAGPRQPLVQQSRLLYR